MARHAPGPWRLLGTGIALPGSPIPTTDLLATVDTRFGTTLARRGGLLARRLGIQTRHACRNFEAAAEAPRPQHTNPQLVADSVRDALVAAKLDIQQAQYLLGHTTTPHTLLPSNIAWAADLLNFDGPFAELRQACTGFAHALMLGTGLLAANSQQPVILVGSETGSVFIDPHRAQTDIAQLVNLVQMGDGAGAAIIASDNEAPGPRLRHAFVGSLGCGQVPGFWQESGGSAQPSTSGIPHFRHAAGDVRAKAAELFSAAISGAVSCGIDLATIDWFLPHQASAAELPRELARLLNVPVERILISADRVGNLGSASIWVGLHLARTSGLLQPGQRVLVLGAEATKYLYGGFVYEHG